MNTPADKKVLAQLTSPSPSGYVPSSFLALITRRDHHQSSSEVQAEFSGVTGFLPDIIYRSAEYYVAITHSIQMGIVSDPSNGMTVILHGDIYADSTCDARTAAQMILTACTADGMIATSRRLNGSFAALIITPDEVTIIIDRVGSKKVFISTNNRGYWISSSLTLHPKGRVDPAGVASLIINRFQYCGRTLYEGVRTLERAHIHTFSRSGVISRCYWIYGFNDVDERAFNAALADRKADLAALVKRAVRRRIPAHGKVLLSLSGGMDSRGILGALLSEMDPSVSLNAVSYGTHQDDDVIVAHELCCLAGIEQRMVSFRGDITEAIKLNGRHCEGLVFFYSQGLDGFEQAVASFGKESIFFVGDECFGWNNVTIQSFDDTLQKGIGIRAPAYIPTYYSYGNTSHRQIQDALQTDIESLKQRCDHTLSWHDLKDYLYLDQRLCHMLLPWREFHSGRYIRVTNPLIDNDILDFMKTVPTTYRLEKRLFRETITSAYPDLFKVRLARPGGIDNQVFNALFHQQQPALEHLVNSFDSALDEVIPPDILMIGLLDFVEHITFAGLPIPVPLQKAANAIHRKLLRVRGFLGSPISKNRRPLVYGSMSLAPLQLATLLQLRFFLRK